MKLFALLAALLSAATLIAQDRPLGAEKAKLEIERRGAHVQVVDDSIQDDGMDAFFAALAIPADDSHKWFLTVVYDKQNAQGDRLKTDMLNSEALRPWVQVKDRGKGTYDVYSTDDSFMHVNFEPRTNPFKPDKWKWIKPEHCPTILIQLPISGEWGKAGLVVNQKVGYDGTKENAGTPETLAEWIKTSIKAYTDKYALTREYREARKRHLIGAFAVSKEGQRQEVGANAPFPVQPKDLGHGADPVSPFPPDLVPVVSKPLTVDQIQAACPGAPPEFVLAQLGRKVSSLQELQLSWLLYQQQKPVTPAPAPAPSPAPAPVVVPDNEPPHPVADWLMHLLAGSGVLLLALKIGLDLYRGYAATTPSKIDDIVVKIGDSIVAQLEKKSAAASSASGKV